MQSLFAVVDSNWQLFVWFGLGLLGAIGLLAVFSPRRFSTLAARGGQWFDSSKLLAIFDKRIDIDSYVLPFSRLLGSAVVMAVVLFGYLVATH